MPVIDRHRYTVGCKFGYPTQKRPSEPPHCDQENVYTTSRWVEDHHPETPRTPTRQEVQRTNRPSTDRAAAGPPRTLHSTRPGRPTPLPTRLATAVSASNVSKIKTLKWTTIAQKPDGKAKFICSNTLAIRPRDGPNVAARRAWRNGAAAYWFECLFVLPGGLTSRGSF
jgi:hypothetical protein